MVGQLRCLLLLVAGLVGCASPADELEAIPDRESRRARLVSAETFLPVLATRPEIDELATYPLVILDPDLYDRDDLRQLRSAGTLTLGYLNIGEAETYRRFYDDVDASWILGDNPYWEGHQYVDVREEGWQRLILDRVASSIVSKEFDGFFLDMVDVAAPGVHPETRDGMLSLIRQLRTTFPTHLLVMNRGVFLLGDVEPDIDGLAIEGVYATHDFGSGSYDRTPPTNREPLLEALLGFRERTGGAALVIDYADTDTLRAFAEAEARRARLPAFVGDIGLAGQRSTP